MPNPSPAMGCFALLCRFAFQLSPELAKAWWEALHLSAHRTCTWITRRLDRYRGSPDHYGVWFIQAVPAKALVQAIECLFEEGRLSRKDATAIEEAIFGLMRGGQWRPDDAPRWVGQAPGGPGR